MSAIRFSLQGKNKIFLEIAREARKMALLPL